MVILFVEFACLPLSKLNFISHAFHICISTWVKFEILFLIFFESQGSHFSEN